TIALIVSRNAMASLVIQRLTTCWHKVRAMRRTKAVRGQEILNRPKVWHVGPLTLARLFETKTRYSSATRPRDEERSRARNSAANSVTPWACALSNPPGRGRNMQRL